MKTLILFSASQNIAEYLEMFGFLGRNAWPSQQKLYQDSTKFTFPKKNAQAFKVR